MPAHRLQMNNTPQLKPVLKMQEPVVALRVINPRALMGTVGFGIALMHNNAVLIRAKNVAAAQHGLPAVFHAARRDKDIVPAVPLVHFGALGGGLGQRAVKDDGAVLHHGKRLGVKAGQLDLVLDAAAAVGKGVRHIDAAVIVPERAGVDPAAGRLYTMQLAPRAAGICGGGVEDALVRQRDKGVKPPVMPAQRRCPWAAAVGRLRIAVKGQPFNAVADALPVDEVAAVQHRHAGQVGKA